MAFQERQSRLRQEAGAKQCCQRVRPFPSPWPAGPHPQSGCLLATDDCCISVLTSVDRQEAEENVNIQRVRALLLGRFAVLLSR